MSVEMSLNAIIAMNRKLKLNKNVVQRGSPKTAFKKQRNANSGRRPFRPVSEAKIHQKTSSIESKIVRINLSNLAISFISSDLQELFGTFNAETTTVHYNQHGESLGTGDVFLPKKDAHLAMKKLGGLALDGKILRMVIVDETTQKKTSRLDLPGRGNIRPVLKKVNRGQVPRQMAKIQKKGGINSKQPKKTVEQLDAELDAYMAGESGTALDTTKTQRKGEKWAKQPQKTMEELDAELDAYMAKSAV